MPIRFVLVEPKEAGNVGACARVMKNFGFDALWIAGRHPELFPVSGWWASGADDLLERTTFVPTLHEAIADCQLVIATTSSRGRTTPADHTPRTLGRAAGKLSSAQTLALVFGREDSGLTREELMLCHQTAVIPTSDTFPTMNLGQALGVFCYELSSIGPAETSRQLPSAAMIERLHTRFESLLVESGFLLANNPNRIYDDIRHIINRASLDERETTILLGMIRQLEWKIRSLENS